MIERRASPRFRVLKAGRIELAGGAIDCVVRNLSATGAALDVSGSLVVPTDFTLVIMSDQIDHPSRVVWRKDHRIGVAFCE